MIQIPYEFKDQKPKKIMFKGVPNKYIRFRP